MMCLLTELSLGEISEVMHKLATYRRANRLTQSAFAKKLGGRQSLISKIESGWAPSLELALKIEQLTDGFVQPKDLASQPAPETSEAQP